MKFGFYTLGCKQNQYETQAMEQLLRSEGHTICSFEDECDCYIINTCTVTAVSDKKSRNMIRRAKKRNPSAVVGVCGCYAQIKPEDITALGVDVVSGTCDRIGFLNQVKEAAELHTRFCSADRARDNHRFEILPAGGLSTRTRAMLKVEDGCDNFCTYCIIPYARGPVRSISIEDAVRQATELAEAGYLELVITGIEISSWGRDLSKAEGKPYCLEDLLEAICGAVPGMRIRLGSLEPRTITEEFCRRLSGFGNLCPQFHLSLQSGSDTVLQRMHRRYDTARYEESVELLNRYFPGCAVTTDLIVAFPGETDAEFNESLAFIRRCGMASVHVFPYSRRAGTVAAKMPGQLQNVVKEARSAAACHAAEELSAAYRTAMLGSEQLVLFEQNEDGCSTGHAMNSIQVYIPEPDHHNEILRVRITGLFRDGVMAEVLL